jgi:hypothetical protein
MPTKRSLNRQLADARAQVRRLADAREEATADAVTEHFGVAYLSKQLDEAREENARLRRQMVARPTTPAVAPDAWPAEPAPPPRPAIAAPAAYEPCHTTTCGHMSTPHDHTAAGLTCRGCGTTKEAL